MRDANRIKPLLEKLEKIWKKYPDLRLGQIVVNAINTSNMEWFLFYVEDDKLIEIIEKWASEQKWIEGKINEQ